MKRTGYVSVAEKVVSNQCRCLVQAPDQSIKGAAIVLVAERKAQRKTHFGDRIDDLTPHQIDSAGKMKLQTNQFARGYFAAS